MVSAYEMTHKHVVLLNYDLYLYKFEINIVLKLEELASKKTNSRHSTVVISAKTWKGTQT